MTEKQKAKFSRSAEFDRLANLDSPYGLDDRDDAQWKKILILDAARVEKRNAWLAAYEAAKETEEWYLYASAEGNAMDMIREGHHAHESLGYYLACFSTLECVRNDA
jgi:hypothetical protein